MADLTVGKITFSPDYGKDSLSEPFKLVNVRIDGRDNFLHFRPDDIIEIAKEDGEIHVKKD